MHRKRKSLRSRINRRRAPRGLSHRCGRTALPSALVLCRSWSLTVGNNVRGQAVRKVRFNGRRHLSQVFGEGFAGRLGMTCQFRRERGNGAALFGMIAMTSPQVSKATIKAQPLLAFGLVSRPSMRQKEPVAHFRPE